jgi:hypothetical protein
MQLDKRPAIQLLAAHLLRTISLEDDLPDNTLGSLISILGLPSSIDVVERIERVPRLWQDHSLLLLEARSRIQDADEFRGNECLEKVYADFLSVEGPDWSFQNLFFATRFLAWKPQEDVIVHILRAMEEKPHSSMLIFIAKCAGAMLYSEVVTQAVLKLYAALSDHQMDRMNFLVNLSVPLENFALKRETLSARIINFLIARPASERALLAFRAESVLPLEVRSIFSNHILAEENLLRCLRAALHVGEKFWFNKLPWTIERSCPDQLPFTVLEELFTRLVSFRVAPSCCREVFGASSKLHGRAKNLDLVLRLIRKLDNPVWPGLLAGLSAEADEVDIVEELKRKLTFSMTNSVVRALTSYLLDYAKRCDQSVGFWLQGQLEVFIKNGSDPAAVNHMYDVMTAIQTATSSFGVTAK